MVTLKIIAKEAGVSPITVSRVLNQKRGVVPISEKTRQRVLEIAHSYNYQPNILARAFKNKKSLQIGVAAVNIFDSYFSRLISASEKATKENNYHLIISSFRESREAVEHYHKLMIAKWIDGVIFMGPLAELNEEFYSRLAHFSHAAVLLARKSSSPKFSSIFNDYEELGFSSYQYLYQLGHRRIGFVNGPLKQQRDCQKRLQGIKKAMETLGGELVYVSHAEDNIQSGVTEMNKIRKKSPLPTAIITYGDNMALGLIYGARAAGIKIPEDCSIFGCDDLNFGPYLFPSLTSVAFPLEQMAKLSIETLIDQLADPNRTRIQKQFPFQIMERASCKKLSQP